MWEVFAILLLFIIAIMCGTITIRAKCYIYYFHFLKMSMVFILYSNALLNHSLEIFYFNMNKLFFY